MSTDPNICPVKFETIIVKKKPNKFALKVKEVREKTGLIGQPLFYEAQRQYNLSKGISNLSSRQKSRTRIRSRSRICSRTRTRSRTRNKQKTPVRQRTRSRTGTRNNKQKTTVRQRSRIRQK